MYIDRWESRIQKLSISRSFGSASPPSCNRGQHGTSPRWKHCTPACWRLCSHGGRARSSRWDASGMWDNHRSARCSLQTKTRVRNWTHFENQPIVMSQAKFSPQSICWFYHHLNTKSEHLMGRLQIGAQHPPANVSSVRLCRVWVPAAHRRATEESAMPLQCARSRRSSCGRWRCTSRRVASPTSRPERRNVVRFLSRLRDDSKPAGVEVWVSESSSDTLINLIRNSWGHDSIWNSQFKTWCRWQCKHTHLVSFR